MEHKHNHLTHHKPESEHLAGHVAADKQEQFHTHKVPDAKNNPIEDLLDLYKETDAVEVDGAIGLKKSKDDSSFKEMIVKNRRRHRLKLIGLFLIFTFLFVAAAGATFFYFGGQIKFSEEDIKVEISGPERVKVGETVEYSIKYRNFSQMEITNAKMLAQFPHGFMIETTTPQIQDHRWPLGDFVFNEGGELKVTGKFIDDLKRDQKFVSTMYYYPKGFSSEFSKEATFSTVVESPNVTFLHNFPAMFTLGTKQNLTIKIKNEDKYDLSDAKLALVVPPSFKINTTKPSQTENKDWLIPVLTAGSETEAIMIEGAFPEGASAGAEDVFKFQLYLKGQENNYYLVKEQELSAKTTDQAVTAALIINGSTENKHIEFGMPLTFSNIAKNGGEDSLENIKVRTVINSGPIDIIDWQKINDENYGKIQKTDGGKEIVWSKTQVAELAKFSPKSEITINFSLPVKTRTQLADVDVNLLAKTAITTYTEIILPLSSGQEGESKLKSSEIKLILDTNVDLTAKALYSLEGTVIGNGPMPPRAGQATRVVVFWDISNELHEIADVSVSAELPDNVKFVTTKNISTGDIKFDEATKKMVWSINRLPKTVASAAVSFILEFRPGSADVGKILKLTGNNILSAKDVETDNNIIKTKNILTTVLEEDELYNGQGTVSP